ncbi:MAG: VOC family protein, partial [Deltaproteobacteria bacterium]|nr:VOC family protein [Deltaproteobacteria bacterium]
MKVIRFDHITIAVHNLDEAIATFTRLFNLEARDRRKVENMGIENVFLPFGDGAIELVEQLEEPGSPDYVKRFLERKGEGMMNLCLTVEDVDGAAAHLEGCGARVVRHQDADGAMIAMVHPKDTHGVMIEVRSGKRPIRDNQAE